MDIRSEKRKLIVSVHNSAKISRVISGNYSYKTYGDIVYNETLFSEYAQTPWSENINFFALRLTIETKLSVVFEILSGLKNYFKDDNFIRESIEEKLLLIELAKTTLPFELEKAGYQLKEQEAHSIQSATQSLETKLYGGKILNNPVEAGICLAYLEKKFQNKKHLLSTMQQEIFSGYIDKIRSHVPEFIPYHFGKILKEHVSFHFFRDIGNIQISKEDYRKIFRLALDISGMQDYSILPWNNGNISLSRESLFIPESSSYNSLPLERVLRIITHEIMVHGISWKNQKRFFGRIKGSGYITREEGLASYMEARLLGENTHTIKLQPMATTRILAGEILDGAEFWNFIELYRILTGQITSSVKNTFLRHKIHHSKTLSGVSQKDTSYMRGLLKIQEYLQENGYDILPLFSGKLSFSDAKEIGSDLIDNQRFVSPVNISDYVVYHLAQKKKFKNYQEFIENKYPDIYTSFRDIDSLSESKQDKLRQLLDIFSSYTHG